ncbi:MAG: thiamine-phosphate kinase, partial [Kiritimatiellia bacterium]
GRWISSLIDISDSPARDITHIAEASAVGAEIEIARLPVSKDAALMADGKKASRHALYDGEDFELMFTVPAEKEHDFMSAWQKEFSLECTALGHITGKPGIIEAVEPDGSRHPLADSGYEHFQS